MSRPRANPQAGFTIVELLIATVVFSLILVVITSGVIRFTQDYYKGIHQSTTQMAARDVMNVIAQNLQYGGGSGEPIVPDAINTDPNRYICVGTAQINYILGKKIGSDAGDSPYAVVVTAKDIDGCKSYAVKTANRELLGTKLRLTNLDVQKVGKVYTIQVGVAYGDTDLLCAHDLTQATDAGGCAVQAPQLPATGFDWATHGASVGCKSGPGAQFCAYSHLSTQVVSRF